MSFNERIRKASQYCESNSGYRVVSACGEKPLLVRDRTGYVKTALLSR